jgi:hypothetical protein
MNQAQLATRQERAQEEPLIIAETQNGWRVYTPSHPREPYFVTGAREQLQCTCPDFQFHANDPEWRCKHILAVAVHLGGSGMPPQRDPDGQAERAAIQAESRTPRKRKTPGANGSGNGAAQMLLKRSVSPDGRIDSLSVEFSAPIGDLTADEVRTHAEHLLGLQAGIVVRFLNAQPNGNGGNGSQRHNNGGNGQAQRSHTVAPQKTPAAAPTASPGIPARLVAVGGMDTRRGRRLFLTVDINGRAQKLFGTANELTQHIRAAGYRAPERLQEGTALDIPCLVTTEPSPDGRFQNVTQVFPVASAQAAQRSRQ